jgi:hypothetical protein
MSALERRKMAIAVQSSSLWVLPLMPLDEQEARTLVGLVLSKLDQHTEDIATIKTTVADTRDDVKQIIADRKTDAPAIAWAHMWRSIILWTLGVVGAATLTGFITDALTGTIGAWKWLGERK